LDTQLADLLIEQGKLSGGDRDRVTRLEASSGESFSSLLLKLGLVSERDLAQALAAQYGFTLVQPEDYPAMPVLEEDLPARFLKERRLIPLQEDDERVVVALADPGDTFVARAIQVACGRRVECKVGTQSDIEAAFERLYGEGRSTMGQIVESITGPDELAGEDDIEHLRDLASEAPVIRLVNLMITRAVESRASDIHVEPFENRLKVRYRIDGVMKDIESPPVKLSAAVISRIKLMAKLNIAERRLPQDGRIQLRVQGKEIDLRVSTVPTMFGESVVMRILDKGSVVLSFDTLGFRGKTLREFEKVLALPHGIILVTGPTGSGKTTTLYTALEKLNTPDRKILTVEDPVEYQLEGINQIQVKPQIGLTFANALRSIVRQDPDVIMIGEMRDLETAGIAVQSALTGHLVLSTLHTNDAASGVTRMLDMGVADYLLTSTVNGILAQRLVRTLCTQCRESYVALPELVGEMHLERFSHGQPVRLYRAVGCKLCAGTGYYGRTSIMELLTMTDTIRRLVLQHADAGDIHREALREGMQTMYEDGLRKAVDGTTTIEDVLRVTQES
jgi:general secretion pathway protein E